MSLFYFFLNNALESKALAWLLLFTSLGIAHISAHLDLFHVIFSQILFIYVELKQSYSTL